MRDAPARIADDFSQPFRWYNAGSERWISLGLSFLDRRAQYLPLDKTLAQTYDPYVFVRDAYLQRRLYRSSTAIRRRASCPGTTRDWAEEALKESEEPAADEGDADGRLRPTKVAQRDSSEFDAQTRSRARVGRPVLFRRSVSNAAARA